MERFKLSILIALVLVAALLLGLVFTLPGLGR